MLMNIIQDAIVVAEQPERFLPMSNYTADWPAQDLGKANFTSSK